MKRDASYSILLFCLFFLLPLLNCLGYDDLKTTYKEFKNKFQKMELTPDQQSNREMIFYQNLEILKIKLEEGCQYCGLTKFFDQNPQQFRSRMGLLPEQDEEISRNHAGMNNYSLIPQKISTAENLIKVNDFPNNKNWAAQGKITSVKNQGSCGTCWSFATVAAIESSLILKGEAINFFFYAPDLSEEFLLTCVDSGTCRGGYLQQTIDLAHEKGLPYEYDVPYQARKGDRGMCSNTKINVKYTDETKARFSFYNIEDSQIINLLQTGPLVIAVSAQNWEYYGGGTFSCNSNAFVNHAVLLVGYDSGRWIIKNQWGEDWGEDGYIYVTRERLLNCRIGTVVHQLGSPLLLFSSLLLLLFFLLT